MEIINIKVIILSQYFYPDIASTGQLLTDLSIGFVKEGYEVKVITAKPNYDNKIYAKSKEIYNNILIKRLFCSRLNKNTKVGTILNSITYFVSVFFYLLFSNQKGTFLIVSTPPFLAIIGLIMNILKGNDFIYLIHDLYPDAAIELRFIKNNSIIAKLWNYFNKLIFKKAKNVVVISESMRETVINRIKNFDYEKSIIVSLIEKVKVIHNWANEDNCKIIEKNNNPFIKNNNIEDKFVIMYSGNFSIDYNLEILIDTARKINNSNFIFIFIGNGTQKNKLMELKDKYNLKNVLFLPYQKYSDIKYSLSSADVLLITAKKNFGGLAMPSKLYTSLAIGRALFLFSYNDCDLSRIINDAKCGFCLKYDDIDGFIEKLIFLKNDSVTLNKMADNARNYYYNNFNFDNALRGYINIIFGKNIN
jgi:glycosyltransferase involved in cell wall biosynthesis